MANDPDRMRDDTSGSPMRGEGDMTDDRMGEGGGSRERGPREGGAGEDMNRDDVRGIAEGDEEFDETEDMDEEEEEEEEL